MDHREKLLSIVKEKGPLLPAQINKELRTNVLFASAMLAEMVDQKKLKLTSMKVGGSPLYYCEGQEPELERFAERLADINLRTYQLLKDSKVLRDRSQDPQTRVALREIKDFAIPLEVKADGKSDLFWKFYLIPDEEASELIKAVINKDQVVKQESQEAPVLKETPKDIQKPVEEVKMTTLETAPEFSYSPSFSFSTNIDTDEKVKIEKKAAPKEKEENQLVFPEEDDFFDEIKKFLDENGIEITNLNPIRKGSEYDLSIKLPSNVGLLDYYCKAKSKSKLNDGDLSSAFVQGLIRKMPILFLTKGDLTKSAEDLLDSEFKNMFVKKI